MRRQITPGDSNVEDAPAGLVAFNSVLTKWNAVLSHGMQSQLQLILS